MNHVHDQRFADPGGTRAFELVSRRIGGCVEDIGFHGAKCREWHRLRTVLLKAIWATLKDHGIEFPQNNGIRQKADGVRDFVGRESCDLFLDDIVQTVRSKGGGLICSIQSEAMLTRVTGPGHRSNVQRLDQLQKLIAVKLMAAGQWLTASLMRDCESICSVDMPSSRNRPDGQSRCSRAG